MDKVGWLSVATANWLSLEIVDYYYDLIDVSIGSTPTLVLRWTLAAAILISIGMWIYTLHQESKKYSLTVVWELERVHYKSLRLKTEMKLLKEASFQVLLFNKLLPGCHGRLIQESKHHYVLEIHWG